jgi:HAD superfamily hydrolase (TIGR01490 family)
MRQEESTARAGAAPRLVFFDLDGTVARRDTLLPYVARYLLPRPWRWWRLAGVLFPLAGFAVGRGDRGALKGALIRAGLGGASPGEIEAWNTRFLPGLLAHGLFPGALAAIESHRRQGDHLVLMSASVDLYVPAIGRHLGFDETICSGVAWTADRLDGRLQTENRRDEEKARCFRATAVAHPGMDTVAYGNSASDLPHMVLATQAVMVNPSPALRTQAEACGIRCVKW